MKKFFRTKKQIVKVGDFYAARYKKWYQLSWRYLGNRYVWNKKQLGQPYVLCFTHEEALLKLKCRFPKIESFTEVD